MSWIVEAIAQAVVEATGDEVVRRVRRRRGLPPLPEPSLEDFKKELVWFAGLALLCGGALALLDGWPAWIGWTLVGMGVVVVPIGFVVRHRMVRRERGTE